jgi:outer membrane protein assembly factor BamB
MSEYRDRPEPLPSDRSVLVIGLNGWVIGIDRATGQKRWETSIRGSAEVYLAIGFGVVAASAWGGVLHVLDYLTGRILWERPTKSPGRATIVIEPDQIVCAKAGYVDCYSPDGRLLWQQTLSGKGEGRTSIGYPGNVAQADERGG